MLERIKQQLQTALNCQELELIDESAAHAGHAGAAEHGGRHLFVRIVSADFNGVNAVQRHRRIHQVLGNAFHQDIHALRIQAISQAEAEQSQP